MVRGTLPIGWGTSRIARATLGIIRGTAPGGSGRSTDDAWRRGDTPPTGPSELSFFSVDTRTPCVIDCPGEDGGKTAHYILRWVVTVREEGPWSETGSPTIGA